MDSTDFVSSFVEKRIFIAHRHDGTPNGGGVIPSDYFTNLYISGKMGIGTTSPQSALDVNGSAIIRSNLTVDGNAFSVGTSTFVVTGGKVGIGTASPQSALDVSGTFRTTGAADIAGWASQSLSANGYAKVGSLYIQWGSLSIADSTSSAVTFPKAFPTVCASISGMQAGNNGADPYVNGFKIVSGPTTTGFTVRSNTNGTNTFYWLAVGY